MVKKYIFSIVWILLFLFMIGCAQTDNDAANEQQLDPLDPAAERGSHEMNNQLNKLGYVRYKKDELNENNEQAHEVNINRDEIANMITRIILRNDDFNEVATLVTDEHVLIAYDVDENHSDEHTLDIAKQTAESIVPSYFEVYVSDDDVLMEDIHSLRNSSTDHKNDDNTLNAIIDQMKETTNDTKNITD